MHSLVWVAVLRTLNIYSVEFHHSKVNACAGSIFDLLQPDSHCRIFTWKASSWADGSQHHYMFLPISTSKACVMQACTSVSLILRHAQKNRIETSDEAFVSHLQQWYQNCKSNCNLNAIKPFSLFLKCVQVSSKRWQHAKCRIIVDCNSKMLMLIHVSVSWSWIDGLDLLNAIDLEALVNYVEYTCAVMLSEAQFLAFPRSSKRRFLVRALLFGLSLMLLFAHIILSCYR